MAVGSINASSLLRFDHTVGASLLHSIHSHRCCFFLVVTCSIGRSILLLFVLLLILNSRSSHRVSFTRYTCSSLMVVLVVSSSPNSPLQFKFTPALHSVPKLIRTPTTSHCGFGLHLCALRGIHQEPTPVIQHYRSSPVGCFFLPEHRAPSLLVVPPTSSVAIVGLLPAD
jgi:hypothetical protein